MQDISISSSPQEGGENKTVYLIVLKGWAGPCDREKDMFISGTVLWAFYCRNFIFLSALF